MEIEKNYEPFYDEWIELKNEQPSHRRFCVWKNITRGYKQCFWKGENPNTIDMHKLIYKY